MVEAKSNVKFNINPKLNVEEYNILNELLLQNISRFAFEKNELGKCNLVEVTINTSDEVPVHKPPYRASHEQHKIILEQVDEMLKNGIIRESRSPYAAPVVLVKKPDNTWRFCVDYRQLNKKVIMDSYPLPIIEDLITYLGNARYFADLDLNSGYWQLPICEKDKHKTAFITPSGLYEFNVLPFGLRTRPLKHRKLLKVSGGDAANFLQGLITNDMRHFDDGAAAKSIYAMFLNNKSRVLYDTLIYKWNNDNNNFLIECDESVLLSLQKHLKLYKLKQAVHVEDINKSLHLWALISPVKNLPQPSAKADTWSSINIFKDPRLVELGYRILAAPAMTACDIVRVVGKENDVKIGDEDIYRYLRYKLGVGEGPEEMPSGLCFPLEANCDYLHGVSFHKGCYIGQELTARVYHTGVVRKRLMPIMFYKERTEVLQKDSVIKSHKDPKSNLGKLKGHIHDYGLGLVRIKEALEAKTLTVGDSTGEIIKPNWWPIEAPKEKLSGKLE